MRRNKKNFHCLQAFTIAEVALVVATLGILATITLSLLNPLESFKKARDTVRIQDANALKSSIILALQNGATFAGRCTPTSPCDSLNGSQDSRGGGFVDVNLSPYLTQLPKDPLHGKGSFKDGKGVTVPAAYQFASLGGDFEIRLYLESKNNTTSPNDKYFDDGGEDGDYYEVGTKLDIL